MPDGDQVRTVVDDALRRNRLPVSTTIARKAPWRLGYAVSVHEVEAVLRDYERQGKITITETTSGEVLVTSISAALLGELSVGGPLKRVALESGVHPPSPER